MTIDVDGERKVVPPADLHGANLPPARATRGNMLLGGLTLVSRGPGGIEANTTVGDRVYVEPHTIPGVSGTAHSEFQYVLGWAETAA